MCRTAGCNNVVCCRAAVHRPARQSQFWCVTGSRITATVVLLFGTLCVISFSCGLLICTICSRLLFLSGLVGILTCPNSCRNTIQLKVRTEAIAHRLSAQRTPLTSQGVPPTRASSSSEVDLEMIDVQVVDDDAQADRAQAGQTLSLDMIFLEVAVELSELELHDDDTLPQRIRL